MKSKSIINRILTVLLPLFIFILFVLLWPGCHRIKPTLHQEIRSDNLSEGMLKTIEEHRQSIPNMMKERKIPGLCYALISPDEILWAGGFGYTDFDCKTPITPETIFALCSISKTLTATVVMLAVQDNLVELNTPIIKYLPDFSVHSHFEENPQDKITLRHLLTHSSGLPLDAIRTTYKDPPISFEEYMLSISEIWLKHKVGERYNYSNCGIDLAGYILQVRSGKPFPRYIKERLLDPLGMSNTSADYEFIRNQPNRAIGHEPHVKKSSLEIQMLGSAGIYSSAADMGKFVQFHINHGKVGEQQVLDQKLIRTMYLSSKTARFAGLGFGMNYSEKNETYIINHSGLGFGFHTTMWWLPEYEIGEILLTNSKYTPSAPILSRLLKENVIEKKESNEHQVWMNAYQNWDKYISPPLPDRETFTTYKPEWKKYVGKYRYIPYPKVILHNYARLGLALGYPHPDAHLNVYEKDGFLEIDGERLDEHLPGLFFTASGEYLDFRGPIPIWKGRKLER